VYAIVRAGGRQEKVAVGDVLEVDRLQAEPGASVDLPVLLLVDGSDVTSDRSVLSGATVTAEVVAATKGPKIDIGKFKNKTGYRRRMGHRQQHTRIRVTGIDNGAGTKVTAEPAEATSPAKKSAATKATTSTPAKAATTKAAATKTAATKSAATKTAATKTATKKTATKTTASTSAAAKKSAASESTTAEQSER
jgi:large subunit ribosomal protein L21